MELTWMAIFVVIVCVVALIFYLIKRNMKDKDEYVDFLNKTEVEEKSTNPKEEE